MDVVPGTVVVYTDVACPWSLVALHRFYRARDDLGLEHEVHVDHRLFLLEDVNGEPTQQSLIDAELPVVSELVPDLGLRRWHGGPSDWPASTLPANEAVHAAKAQSPAAAEQLDLALRLAFLRDSRCITLQHVVLDVARSCDAVDPAALAEALDDGRARAAMMAGYRAGREHVRGSPHFFLPDGVDELLPGIEIRWEGGAAGQERPVVDRDDPGRYGELVEAALGVGLGPGSAFSTGG